MKVFLITNIPAPYIQRIFQTINKYIQGYFIVGYCAKNESNRNWHIEPTNYSHVFLSGISIKLWRKVYYLNYSIIKELKKQNPDIIVLCGFNPTMLIAYFWAKWKKRGVIYYSDANLKSEEGLSIVHRFFRNYFLPKYDAVIGVSNKSIAYYEEYGVDRKRIFLSHYAIDNEYFMKFKNTPKKYDILFSGQFIDRKRPDLFIAVVNELKKSIPEIRILLLGGGELKEYILTNLRRLNVNFDYFGNLNPQELIPYYASCKLLLFTTKSDAWGVVANEACSLGIPVLISENAGAADDIIIHNFNGFVLNNNDIDSWVKYSKVLLSENETYKLFSSNAINMAEKFNAKKSAEKQIESFNFVHNIKKNINSGIVLITNIPSPYRQKTYEYIGSNYNKDFVVYYCAKNEANRDWNIKPNGYNYVFLKVYSISIGYSKYLHFNYTILSQLNIQNPKVVAIGGFSPTMIFAYVWCVLKNKKVVYMSAENEFTSKDFNVLQLFLRLLLLKKFDAYLAISKSTARFFSINYKINLNKIFVAPNAIEIDNQQQVSCEKKFDVLYSGQFIERKDPELFLSIIQELKLRVPNLRVLLLGKGPKEKQIIQFLKNFEVEFEYPGNLPAGELIKLYSLCKILIFTTKNDAWGVVANEACIAGVPVLISKNAGAANDLIIDNFNGFVINSNDVNIWVEKAYLLLTDNQMYERFSINSREQVKKYNAENSAKEYINCFNSLLNEPT